MWAVGVRNKIIKWDAAQKTGLSDIRINEVLNGEDAWKKKNNKWAKIRPE